MKKKEPLTTNEMEIIKSIDESESSAQQPFIHPYAQTQNMVVDDSFLSSGTFVPPTDLQMTLPSERPMPLELPLTKEEKEEEEYVSPPRTT